MLDKRQKGGSLIALLTLVVTAAIPATVRGAAGQPVDVDASVVPINVDAALVPINVQGSIQPLEVQHEQGALTTVTLSSDVLFAFNSSSLTGTAQQTIDGLAGRLRSSGAKRISVDGYTDSIGSGRLQPRPLSPARRLGAAGAERRARWTGSGPDSHSRARRGEPGGAEHAGRA
jgi:outer membrane protein OmpA-like peptidoglycan-associated protein